MNFKKIIFFALAITIIFSGIEIITKFSLKYLGYSTVYKTGNIPDNRYNYLTGYYNEPNKKPKTIKGGNMEIGLPMDS